MAGRCLLRFRSLRARFLFYFLVLSGISLVLFGSLFAYFVVRENRRLMDNARRELVEQAGEMARDLALLFGLAQQYPSLALANAQRVTQLLRLEGKLINAVSAVVNERGEVTAPRPAPLLFPRSLDKGLLAQDQVKAQETEFPRMGKVLVVAVPLDLGDPESLYNLVVAKRTGDLVTSASSALTRYLLIAGISALVASVLLALYLSNYVSRPLQRLSRVAWELAQGELRSRMEVAGEDEISELCRYFNYMAERIDRSTRQQKEFVANVSHEIRTPLTSVEGFSQALLEGMVESEEDRKRYLEIICEECRRLKRVLSQLLALSRIDSGAWALRPVTLSPGPLLEDLTRKMRPLAEEKGIHLELQVSKSLRDVVVDGDALEMVLTNLLENALKFTPGGGTVVLSAETTTGGWLRVQVRDNGPGIPPEDLERIFDRFFRVERSRAQEQGGSGLGLAICRELVLLMGGRIHVWSEPGRGSAFVVEIPPSPAEAAPRAAASSLPHS